MAVSTYLDLTADLVANAQVTIDTSGWDNVIVQAVSPTGTINITASNDGNEIQGSTISNATAALNFTGVQATKLLDGTAVTAIATAGMYRLGVVGRYVRFGGAAASATKFLVELYKIC
jgi:hypothetical protein